MKRINSIYRIFVLFLAIIVVSFLILYCYSTINLKTSLRRVAKIQMEYSYDQLEQKIKEIELEASSILTREETKLLQVAIVDNEDIYSYVMKVKTMQEIFQEKQKTNSGMAEFDLYWPEEQRIVSSTTITSIKGKKILDKLQDNQWIISENEVYFCRQYVTKWDDDDDEPYLIIRMERDWLYRIKNMASGFSGGGTLCLFGDEESLFPVDSEGMQIQNKMKELTVEPGMQEIHVKRGHYQIVTSGIARNGISLVTYYPLSKMLLPVNNMTYITGGLLIEMPKEIGELPIIPLILEPLIENAIEHGLEGCESAKQIEIEIDWTKNGAVSFAISDDGEGMTKEQVSALKERISRKERKEEESVGLWNVNQRLINYYSKSAALGFKRSRWGGLTVYFMIRPEKKKEEESDASIDCR